MKIKPSVTTELGEWIRTYGSERDALNVALAHLQALRVWVIAQEKCPNCFGDLKCNYETFENVNLTTYYECLDCSQCWLYLGIPITL